VDKVIHGVSRRPSFGASLSPEDVLQVKDLDAGRVLSFAPIKRTTFHTEFESTEGQRMYFLGIIDILTSYSVLKSLEATVKKSGASVMPPAKYAARFVRFIDSIVD